MSFITKIYCFLLIFIASTTCSFATIEPDEWASYIDGSVGKIKYYLYNQVLQTHFQQKQHYRALNLGSGAGDIDYALAAKGWDVTSIDISARSGEVMRARIQYIHGQFQFQHKSFEEAQLEGNYDLVISFFAFPFGNKDKLSNVLKNASQHMKTGSVFTANFFGYEHSFVKDGFAYGLNKKELDNLLTLNGLKVQYFLNRHFVQQDFNGNATNWDVLDLIAVKL